MAPIKSVIHWIVFLLESLDVCVTLVAILCNLLPVSEAEHITKRTARNRWFVTYKKKIEKNSERGENAIRFIESCQCFVVISTKK